MKFILALLGGLCTCSVAFAQGKETQHFAWGAAQQAAIEALPQSQEFFKTAVEEWKKDAAAYSFAVKRYGDFLVVFISRGNEKHASALNLGATTEIKLTPGSEPDLKGKLNYSAYVVKDKDSDLSGGYGGNGSGGVYGRWFDDTKPPPQGYAYKVVAVSLTLPTRRMIYTVPPPQPSYQGSGGGGCCGGGVGGGYYEQGNYQGPAVTGIARPAKDDEIYMTGIATTIYAPAGRGAEVQEIILKEIARGYEPPKLGGRP